MSVDYPSMKAADLYRILRSLGYETDRVNGSHKRMKAGKHPPLTFAFHDGQTIPPGLVKKILTKDIGLSEEEIRNILKQK
jgi:predicted RNA binding protein YcfA (HicA-like mRNA interferase family)